MFAGQQAAASRLGQTVSGIGEQVADIGVKIKHATDSAYVVGAHAGLEAASQEFETWTKTNPDTSTWQAKQDEVVLNAKEKALGGSGNLNFGAKSQLVATVGAWETRFGASSKWLKAGQDVNNANGTFQDAWNQATAANDIPALENIAASWKASGAAHPQRVENLMKASTQKIAGNIGNARIDADPFTATFDDIPHLTETAKVSLQFRAAKMQAEQRRGTQASLLQMKDKLGPEGTLPDPDDREAVPELGGMSIHEVTEHQKINPKWIANLYKPPVKFEAKTYTNLTTQIATADVHDMSNPANPLKGELISAVYDSQLPTATRTQLLQDIEKKADLKSDVNTPVARSFFEKAKAEHGAGLFLPPNALSGKIATDRIKALSTAANSYASAAKEAAKFEESDTSTEAVAARQSAGVYKQEVALLSKADNAPKDRAGWENSATEVERDAESANYADYLTKMRDFFAKKPDATDVEAEDYAQALRRPHVMAKVSAALKSTGPAKRRLVQQGGKTYDYNTGEEVK